MRVGGEYPGGGGTMGNISGLVVELYGPHPVGQTEAMPCFTAYWINSAMVRRFRSSMIRYL